MSTSANYSGSDAKFDARIWARPRRDYPSPGLCMVGVELARGGDQYRAYGKLDPLLKAQWDALEAFLTRISEKRYLYVLGCFNFEGGWSIDDHKSLIFGRDKTLFGERPLPGWSGVYGPCDNQRNLHELLVANPNEYYYFLVVDEPLEPQSALNLYGEADHGGWDALYQKVRDLIRRPYCGMAEGHDRDCISIQCHDESFAQISDILNCVLTEFGLELVVDTKTPSVRRRRTEY